MSRNKQRTTVWLSKEVMERIDSITLKSNSKSRSELIETAIEFYEGYLNSINNQFMPHALNAALKGNLQLTEDRISALLFKNAVELDMIMNILGATAEIDEETLNKLRKKCIENVKETRGRITFEKAYRYQKG